MGLHKGDIIDIEFVDLANGGDAVGRYERPGCFHSRRNTWRTGESTRGRKKKNYARGR